MMSGMFDQSSQQNWHSEEHHVFHGNSSKKTSDIRSRGGPAQKENNSLLAKQCNAVNHHSTIQQEENGCSILGHYYTNSNNSKTDLESFCHQTKNEQPLGVTASKRKGQERKRSFVSKSQGHHHDPLLKMNTFNKGMSQLLEKSLFLLSDDLPPIKPLKWQPKVYKICHVGSQHGTITDRNTFASQSYYCSHTRGKKLPINRPGNHCSATHHDHNTFKNVTGREIYLENAKKNRERIHNSKMFQIQEIIAKKEQNRLKNNLIQKTKLRQEKIHLIVTLGSSLYHWLKDGPDILAKFQRIKSLDYAARIIQHKWKHEMFIRKIFDARRIQQSLKTCKGQIKLFVQHSRQNLYSRVIKSFLFDVSKYPLSFVFYKFRQSVLNAQKMMYGFIKCKRARLEALEEQWYRIERELVTVEESKIKRRRQKHHDVLTDISHRKILSKDLVSIVKNVAGDVEDQEQPSSDIVIVPHKDETSTEWVKILCRFHLEERRHYHIEQQTIKNKGCQLTRQESCQQSATLHDARKFLEGTHEVKNLVAFDSLMHGPFFLYCKSYDHLHAKIKEFRRNTNIGIQKIQEQLKHQEESFKANRYAACDSPCSNSVVAGMMRDQFSHPLLYKENNVENEEENSDMRKKAIDPYLQELETTSIYEIRTLFHLIDTNSKGFLTEENVESLFAFVGYGRGNKGAALISGVMADKSSSPSRTPKDACQEQEVILRRRENIGFEDFLMDLNAEINRVIQYPMELVLQAFDHFSDASDMDDENDGNEEDRSLWRANQTIQREQLIEILMYQQDAQQQHTKMATPTTSNAENDSWTQEDAASQLDCIGWIDTNIAYDKIVRNMYKIWESKSLGNFLSVQ